MTIHFWNYENGRIQFYLHSAWFMFRNSRRLKFSLIGLIGWLVDGLVVIFDGSLTLITTEWWWTIDVMIIIYVQECQTLGTYITSPPPNRYETLLKQRHVQLLGNKDYNLHRVYILKNFLKIKIWTSADKFLSSFLILITPKFIHFPQFDNKEIFQIAYLYFEITLQVDLLI